MNKLERLRQKIETDKKLLKPFIAKILYLVGIKPKVTTFISGYHLSYGYGKLYGVGVWEYQLKLVKYKDETI